MSFIERIFESIIEWMYKFEGKDAKYFFSIAHHETHPQYGTASGGAMTKIQYAIQRKKCTLVDQKQYGAPRDRVVFTYRTGDGDEFIIQYCIDNGFAYSSETVSYEHIVASTPKNT